MVVPSIGNNSSTGGGSIKYCEPTYNIVNDGTYGISTYKLSSDGKHTQWWGNQKAVQQVKLADDGHGEPLTPPGECTDR
jgi:hypothetical protein